MTLVTNKGVPYIGVTDFTSYSQVVQAATCIPESAHRRLHVGVMMSYKTFHGIPTETGWEKIWPRGDTLRSIFQPHPKVFNVLHWADYGYPYCLTSSHDLILAAREAGEYLQGVQLDMLWPRAELIADLKSAMPHLEIIVQAGKKALLQMEDVGGHLDEALLPYVDKAEYILVDWGMGKGEPMSLPHVLGYLQSASQIFPVEKLAIAGGLGPNSYQVLQEVVELYPNISCDAQGQMRLSGKATDPIELDRVCGYIQGVCSFLK